MAQNIVFLRLPFSLQVEVTNMLIERGADVAVQNKDGGIIMCM
jgi:hypothetical protein